MSTSAHAGTFEALGNTTILGTLRTRDAVTFESATTYKRNVVALTAATTVTIAQSGSVFTLGTAGGFTVTLPAVSTASGVFYEFLVKVAPTTDYFIVTNGGEDKIHGTNVSKDLNAANDTDVTFGTAADKITLVSSKAQIGDRVTLFSDGTFWYSTAITAGDYDAVTYTQT